MERGLDEVGQPGAMLGSRLYIISHTLSHPDYLELTTHCQFLTTAHYDFIVKNPA